MESGKIIKLYCDSGANIKYLKKYKDLEFYKYPYDKNSRGKKLKHKLPKVSELTWEMANTTWEESTFTWGECEGSEKYEILLKMLTQENIEDVLHLDSAYKTEVDIFITSDKDDIESKKEELEALLNFKIFFHGDEAGIEQYIEGLQILKNNKAC